VYYAKNSLQLGQNNKFGEHTSDAAAILTEVYELQHRPDSSLKYLKVLAALKDSIFSQSKLEQVMLLNFEEGQRQKDLDIARERYQNQVRLYALIAAAGIFLFVSIVLYRNNQHKQRANTKLESQKDEIDRQRSKAECALQDLKSAQAQLVQSEKMASLGELTAGIAHEIQNPLNFVNNFSEINSELLGELEFEIEKNNFGAMKNIVADLRENEEKIAHHGKRADSIVKGMLQHSRTGSGQLELTDLNALADEYLRLSYHGMRARDKAFNAVLLTDFDKKIEKIAIIRQDFSRVFLNLYNNAFYAVLQKQKNGIQINDSEGKCYEPTILVATKKLGDHIEIRVKDNGNGISERIKDKIFQPFFTTKDAGQGTGLGLSLVYDIITKEHGGQIKVETNENHYTEFIIQIPLKEHF
jgi:signal transduction histidine kinase